VYPGFNVLEVPVHSTLYGIVFMVTLSAPESERVGTIYHNKKEPDLKLLEPGRGSS
jgi:hypothetical protein